MKTEIIRTRAAARRSRSTRPATWLALLKEGAQRHGQEVVLTVPEAVEWVYGLATGVPAPERHQRMVEAKTSELLAQTAGQPFRLETPAGPLFVGWALFDFAGGREVAYGTSPAWDGLEAIQ